MRLFLIDYENVNSAGLHGIGQINPEDRAILFYSRAANTLSFEIMDEMMAAGIMPERVCLEHSGKNALDFQLVTFLGYLAATENAEAIFIISKDSGYHAAISFCKTYLGVKEVHLKPSIKQALGSLPRSKAKAAKQSPAVQPLTEVKVKKAAKAQPVLKKTKDAPAKTQPAAKKSAAAEPKKKKGKPASVSLRKKATVIQVQPAGIGSLPVTVPQQDAVPFDLQTVMSLVQPPIAVDTASEILHCLLDSRSKTEFHNALQQHFDNGNAKLYYHCMKPCFSAFKE